MHNGTVESGSHSFVVESKLEGETATITATGELDIATRRKLSDEMVSLVARGAAHLIVDMSGVSFLDSSGLGALLGVRHLGASLVLRKPSPAVRRVLDLVLVDGIISVEGT